MRRGRPIAPLMLTQEEQTTLERWARRPKSAQALAQDATHRSTRSMAQACGLSHTTVRRIWNAFALAPHRSETFKLSKGPLFIEKVRDIVGLYLNPPTKALVLCVDEKAQIQALDRSQPVLPTRPGQNERRSHDYTRHVLPRCLLPSKSKVARLSANFIVATARWSSVSSSIGLIKQCLSLWTFT